MKKLAGIDFEYSKPNNKNPKLVCASIRVGGKARRYWLHRQSKFKLDYDELLKDIKELDRQGFTFIAYSCVAEGRCFINLGLNPLNFKWIDNYLEYRCLTNHNHRWMYGKQLKKGWVSFTKPPPKNKWSMTQQEMDEADNSKPEHNYASACFKVLKVEIDTDRKTEMRDLIISDPEEYTEEQMTAIMDYCDDDTKHLIPMFKGLMDEHKRLLGERFKTKRMLKEMFKRSEYACRTAHMEQLGYPIDFRRTKNFSSQVPVILWKCQKEIATLFPENPIFELKTKSGCEYKMTQKNVRWHIDEWLKKQDKRTKWIQTEGGKKGVKQHSLSLKAFTKFFSYRHTYPKDCIFAQIIRFLKLKQNLNGFLPGGKKSFWDSVGDDQRVRPYMGIYGAQSSRSQPGASGFIPLKSAWMRCLIYPPKGMAMGSIDFASQEFLLAALMSKDKAMIEAYQSGDVYLAFGKAISYIPQEATKKSHKAERDNCKAVVLGLSYDMSKYGLAIDLTEKFGRKVTTDEAQGWINKHKKAYPTFWRWKESFSIHYQAQKFVRLPDGWYMWGDNHNFRSVGNVPIQGMGAAIMRKAVQLAQNAGLDIPYTLHDALYLLGVQTEIVGEMKILAECMDQAFRFYFPEEMKEIAEVRLDGDIWGVDWEEDKVTIEYSTINGELKMDCKIQDVYIDERGAEEYESFKQYFEVDKINYTEMEF